MPGVDFLDPVLSVRMPQPQAESQGDVSAPAPEPNDGSTVDAPADGDGHSHLSTGQISAAIIVVAIVGIALLLLIMYYAGGRALIARLRGRPDPGDESEGDYVYHRACGGHRRRRRRPDQGNNDGAREDRAKSRGEEEKKIESSGPPQGPEAGSASRLPTEATAAAGLSRDGFETAQVRGADIGGMGFAPGSFGNRPLLSVANNSDFPVTPLAPAPQRWKSVPTPAAYEQRSSSQPVISSSTSPYDQNWPLGPSTEQADHGRGRAATFSIGSDVSDVSQGEPPAMSAPQRADSFEEISLN